MSSPLVLYPRAVSGDRLRLWVGAFGRTHARPLEWELDGRSVKPEVLRPLAPARSGDLLDDPGERRAYTGVYQIRAPSVIPGSRHAVAVRDGAGGIARARVRALPDRVPSGPESRFNVLLVSCFHRLEDRRGFAGHVAGLLPPAYRPDLTVLMGDQVYLDLPTLRNFRDDPAWLARKFEDEDYRENWAGAGGYSRILAAAPAVHLPDDHEYWNNYPHLSPFIQNTWTAEGRARWRKAARALWQAFQGAAFDARDLGEAGEGGEPPPQPEPGTRAVELEVDPLSFFFLDTRSWRAEDRSASAHPAVREQLRRWARRVVERRRIAVVATGQSFLDEERGQVEGAVGDYTLPNYSDYQEIATTLAGVPEAGLPILLLTGDVHWGRVVAGRDVTGSGRELVHEVITSPSSLVTTVGSDQLAAIGGAFRAIFGKRREWERHGDPGDPPSHLMHPVLGSRFPIRTRHRQKGDQVATLTFRRAGFGVDAEVRYWPIRKEWRPPRPDHAGTLRLRPV